MTAFPFFLLAALALWCPSNHNCRSVFFSHFFAANKQPATVPRRSVLSSQYNFILLKVSIQIILSRPALFCRLLFFIFCLGFALIERSVKQPNVIPWTSFLFLARASPFKQDRCFHAHFSFPTRPAPLKIVLLLFTQASPS